MWLKLITSRLKKVELFLNSYCKSFFLLQVVFFLLQVGFFLITSQFSLAASHGLNLERLDFTSVSRALRHYCFKAFLT